MFKDNLCQPVIKFAVNGYVSGFKILPFSHSQLGSLLPIPKVK